MQDSVTIQLNPAAATTTVVNLMAGALRLLSGAGDGLELEQLKQYCNGLSLLDFRAVENEVTLTLISCPPMRVNAVKRAFWRIFRPAMEEVPKQPTNNPETDFYRALLSTVVVDRQKRLNDLMKRTGVYQFAGLAYALRDYITGATDEGLTLIIGSKGKQRPAPAPCWVGTQSDAERFAKAAGLTANGFNYAFGRILADGRLDPGNTQPVLRFGNMKTPKEATTDNRHPKLLSIIENFGLVLPE
ncbi:MAG: hypothetical protein J5917_05370 [Bacteroidales bacterium]|nr:hypothetical protein [Bacteroidales bacterium]